MTFITYNLLYLLIAIVTVFGSLRILDKLTGESFKSDLLPVIKQSPCALALFRGAWVIGVCHLAGSMLGV